MQIGLKDIDPVIASLMEDRLAAPLHKFLRAGIFYGLSTRYHIPGFTRGPNEREADENERRAMEYRLQQDRIREKVAIRRLMSLSTAVIVGLFIAVMAGSDLSPFAPLFGVWIGLLTYWCGLLTGVYSLANRSPQARLDTSVSVAEMRAVFPLLVLTDVERRYCETLEWLVGTVSYVDDRAAHEIVGHLNELLANSRRLEEQRAEIQAFLLANPLPALLAQRDELEWRWRQAVDEAERESLAQAVALCRKRLEDVSALNRTVKRLDAQLEVVMQTFATVRSSLTRSQLAPVAAATANVGELQRTVAEVSQTIEKSVQEVLSLRAN